MPTGAMTTPGNTSVADEELRERTALAVREIYRPLIRGYFAAFAIYYSIITPIRFFNNSGFEMGALVAASLVGAALGIMGAWHFRKPDNTERVEWLLLFINCAVVANIGIALQVAFDPEKLIHFIIVAMLFALSSLSLRQALVSIAIVGIVFAGFLNRLDADSLASFGYISIAAVMAAVATTFLLRNAVVKIAQAKILTEQELAKAHEASAEMREKSLSDSLTLLPNRRAFFKELRRVIGDHSYARADGNTWLMLLDLDGFKAVNDIHGHLTGDALLQQVAGRLERFADKQTHVSRMGGDEFNLIMTTNDSEAQLVAKCQELLDLLSVNYIIDGRQIRISCSMGCKLLDFGETSRTQINQADFALMSAKRQGKNRVVVFDDAHAERAAARFKIESALREANLEEELSLVFQPQLDLSTNTFVRAEVLLRWCSPTIGVVSPKEFITIAEESGLITDITLLVVTKVFTECIKWPQPIPLAVNLSSLDLISDTIIDQIIDAAKSFGVDRQLFEFEVTESAMLADFEKASANLRRLSNVGFTIALDDFGTGYSNFNTLRSLPINKLKVDRSLLENPGDPMTDQILLSLVAMSRALKVHCLLEGVESELDLLTAKRVNAGSVQGFLFGRPMEAAALQDMVAEQEESAKAVNAG